MKIKNEDRVTYQYIKETYGGKYKEVGEGLILIDKNGEGFRKLKDGYAKIGKDYKLNGNIAVVTRRDEGNYNYYLHREVAKLYVKNPNGYKYVDFKDGNKENVRSDNLVWVDETSARLDNMKLMKKRLGDTYLECKDCGGNAQGKEGVCTSCLAKRHSNNLRKNKLSKIKETFKGHEKLGLEKRLRDTVEKRKQGMTYDEIGVEEGITREGVRKRLLNVERKLEGN